MSSLATGVLQGSALFGRVYSLALQGQDGQGAVWGNESKTQSALRVTFEVERAITGGNKAKVVIYNVGQSSRRGIIIGSAMRLRAGYAGLVGVLFTGVVSKVETERQGSDIATSIELKDGEPYSNMSVIDRSYAAGTHIATILNDVAQAMSVTLNGEATSVQRGVAVGIPDHVYAQGFVAHGPCKGVLDTLCRPRGLEWSVQNGALNIIPKTAYNGRTVQILSPSTGLLGVPSTNGKLVTFSALLNPRLVPGGLVQLDTANQALVGIYKVRTAKYQGDSHDAAWNVAIEAVPFDGIVKRLPAAAGQTYANAVGQ